MAVTVRVVSECPIEGDSHGALINRTAVKKKGGGGGTFLARSIRNAGGTVRFHFRARYKERASAGKWTPAIPAVN